MTSVCKEQVKKIKADFVEEMIGAFIFRRKNKFFLNFCLHLYIDINYLLNNHQHSLNKSCVDNY